MNFDQLRIRESLVAERAANLFRARVELLMKPTMLSHRRRFDCRRCTGRTPYLKKRRRKEEINASGERFSSVRRINDLFSDMFDIWKWKSMRTVHLLKTKSTDIYSSKQIRGNETTETHVGGADRMTKMNHREWSKWIEKKMKENEQDLSRSSLQ